jgi:hypothetical protein
VLYLDKLLVETENEGVEGHNENAVGQQRGINWNAAWWLCLGGQHQLRRKVSQLQRQVNVMQVNQTQFHKTVNKNVNWDWLVSLVNDFGTRARIKNNKLLLMMKWSSQSRSSLAAQYHQLPLPPPRPRSVTS